MIRRAAAALGGLLALPVQAAPLVLPDGALRLTQRDGGAVATGPAGAGGVPLLPRNGPVRTEAWRLPGAASTEAVLADIASQLAAAGWSSLFTCETRACGGFDFRYGLPVIPEPDMHVSLGDFRYLAARAGEAAVGVLVSRSGDAAHVEITRIGPPAPGSAPGTLSATGQPADAVRDGLPPEGPGEGPGEGPEGGAEADLEARLLSVGHVALDDLDFAVGAATLTEGARDSLGILAAFLQANPDARLMLVGHTDNAGSLAANISLSRRRAEAVAQLLVTRFGVNRAQVAAEGAGWLAPRASNGTPEGRQANRRVEAVLTAGP